MTELNVMTVVGLIGITLVVATGKVFDGLRSWLTGFTHRWNPLRWVGEAMSCTMCAGWWVGFVWGLCMGSHVITAAVWGGVISLVSYVTDEVLAILAATSIRMVRPRQTPVQVQQRTIRAQRAPEDPPLSEEDANHMADDEEKHADGNA